MIKKIRNWKLKIRNWKSGMTYVELIVVLGIFAVMSSIVLFNYGEFQAKVDIKNLASDIALKIVEAQKSALSGNSPSLFGNLKPSYGVYFDTSSPTSSTSFIYFADKNNNSKYDDSTTDTILDTISITKNNKISRLGAVGCVINNKLSIIFKRPDSSAKFASSGVLLCTSVQISIASPKLATATINVFPSGRVQVN